MFIRSRQLVAVVVLVAGLPIVGCSGNASDDELTSTVASSSSPSPTVAPSAPATPEASPEPTVLPPSDLEIEVGAIRLTNIRFEPAEGVIAPREKIVITADVESSFDGELRVFIAPIGDEPSAFDCATVDGNQAFTLGTDRYERWMRPIDLREGCELPTDPVRIVGFEVRVFSLDDESSTIEGTLPANFRVDPSLPPAP